ncbi:MAG: hypothetical protein V4622_01915 [Bacteroidota bacterium]
MKIYLSLLFLSLIVFKGFSQETENKSGWFSLGGRSTISSFSHDGFGIGTGGQFRIQVNNSINTDWFADYISINIDDKIRSDYYHIGWSVLVYPFEKKEFNKKITPYFLAGHCFDFNRKIEIQNPNNAMQRWGSAVQAGLGVHFNLTNRLDISLTSQYMMHLTNEIDYHEEGNNIHFEHHKHQTLEGHLLSTVSLNYKIVKLWGRK